MSYRKITQCEARELRRELETVRDKLNWIISGGKNGWAGTPVGSQVNTSTATMERLRTARKLGYSVFVVADLNKDELFFHAVKRGE